MSDPKVAVTPWRAPQVTTHQANASPGATKASQSNIEEEARKKGYGDGFAEGKAAALSGLAEQGQRFQNIVDCLDAPLGELDHEVECQLVHLAITIASQLVRRELRSDPKQVLGVVRESLKILPVASRSVQVHLHPEDADLVREVLIKPGHELAWEIVEDPMLTRGGCHVTTSASHIDARVESRIGKIFAELISGDRESDG